MLVIFYISDRFFDILFDLIIFVNYGNIDNIIYIIYSHES